MNWISVEDRLPNVGEYVVCYLPCSFKMIMPDICEMKIMRISTDNIWHEYNKPRPDIKITHWMPLPEVP